jgi:hypothetical protein
VARNTALREAPSARAAEVYTGVLYAAAGLADLPDDAARRAHRSVLTFSGLWGVVAPGDRIPAYRLGMGVSLPDVGRLAAFWKSALAEVLDARAAGDVVVDCRSATYVAAWKPRTTGDDAAEWVEVRVLRETDGKRTVVSHNAKHTRGVLAGHLLRREHEVRTSEDVLKAAQELVGSVVLTEIGSGKDQTLIEATLLDGRPAPWSWSWPDPSRLRGPGFLRSAARESEPTPVSKPGGGRRRSRNGRRRGLARAGVRRLDVPS